MRLVEFIHRLPMVVALLLSGGALTSAYAMPSAGQKVAQKMAQNVVQNVVKASVGAVVERRSRCPQSSKATRSAVQVGQVLVDDTMRGSEERPRPPSSSSPAPRPDNNSKPSRQPCCLSGKCARTCFTTVSLVSAAPAFAANRNSTEVARPMYASGR